METGRADYNVLVKHSAIQDDEPIFILRAQDPSAGDAVRAWVTLSAMAGVPPATLESALKQADRMEAWPHRKAPGDDHLSEAQRRQLEYEHRRRVWDFGRGDPVRLAAMRDHHPVAPAVLLRQLAAEQHEHARVQAFAAERFTHAANTPEIGAGKSWETQHLQAAKHALERTAYFHTVGCALAIAMDAIDTLARLANQPGESGGTVHPGHIIRPGHEIPAGHQIDEGDGRG